jgi:hypothetical protein
MMSDEEFLAFAYRRVLGREATAEEAARSRDQLRSGSPARHALVMQLLSSAEREAQLDNAEFVPAGHFYSVVPARSERDACIEDDSTLPDALPGIDLRVAQQLALLDELAVYAGDCSFPETESEEGLYHFDNPAYAYADGLTLHAMLRHLRPRRVIEVGSGFSSCAIVDTRRLFLDPATELTFIEPFPELLRSRLGDTAADYRLIPERVQDVELSVFEALEDGDFLIIDSTHVAKLGSDVLRLVFEVLPALSRGVFVHFHDIFWPFEYPKKWISEGRAWNEAYLLRAFLQNNDAFEIVYFYSYLEAMHRDRLASRMPLCLKRRGANLWLRKVADRRRP